MARGWGSVFTVGLTIASIVYGPMLGAFLLGVLTKSANERGVIGGYRTSRSRHDRGQAVHAARVDLVRPRRHRHLHGGRAGGSRVSR